MNMYQISLTNPDDQSQCAGLSYTSGRYGFTVRADDMAGAIGLTVNRARDDDFYGYDWSAKINLVGQHGQINNPLAWLSKDAESIVGLFDEPKPEWLALYGETADRHPTLPGGGVRLW